MFWLAPAIGERLEQLGSRGKSLVNAAAVVRRIAEQQGRQVDRYCDLDTVRAGSVVAHTPRQMTSLPNWFGAVLAGQGA